MKKILGLNLWFLLPWVVFAQTGATVGSILDKIAGLIGIFVPIIAGLAMLAFIWGVALSIFQSGDARAQSQGKSMMIWGVVGLFVMLSVWGIVTVLANTFGTGLGGGAIAPQL